MHNSPQVLHKTPHMPIRLHAAGPYEAPQGRHFPPHRDAAWEIIYYRAGHIQGQVGNEIYQSEPGLLVTIPPGVIHSETAHTAYANFWIQINVPEPPSWPRRCYDDETHILGQVCSAIVREYSLQTSERESMLAALLTQIDIYLRRAHERCQLPAAERLVHQVEQILEERYATPISIASVAKEIGVSPSHLRAQFARLRGQTPMAYLHALRVQQALRLIRTSTLTLEIIAGFCGFDSASHLSRHVKRTTGKSPGAFRATGDFSAIEVGNVDGAL